MMLLSFSVVTAQMIIPAIETVKQFKGEKIMSYSISQKTEKEEKKVFKVMKIAFWQCTSHNWLGQCDNMVCNMVIFNCCPGLCPIACSIIGVGPSLEGGCPDYTPGVFIYGQKSTQEDLLKYINDNPDKCGDIELTKAQLDQIKKDSPFNKK